MNKEDKSGQPKYAYAPKFRVKDADVSISPSEKLDLPAASNRGSSVANYGTSGTILYGNNWNAVGSKLMFAMVATAFLAAIAYMIYAIVNGWVYSASVGITHAGGVCISLLVQLAGSIFLLESLLKSVIKAELTNYRLKISTCLKTIDIPVESIKDLTFHGFRNTQRLITREGEFLFNFKESDKSFIEGLRSHINATSSIEPAKFKIAARLKYTLAVLLLLLVCTSPMFVATALAGPANKEFGRSIFMIIASVFGIYHFLRLCIECELKNDGLILRRPLNTTFVAWNEFERVKNQEFKTKKGTFVIPLMASSEKLFSVLEQKLPKQVLELKPQAVYEPKKPVVQKITFVIGGVLIVASGVLCANSIFWLTKAKSVEAKVVKMVTHDNDGDKTYTAKLQFKLASGKNFTVETLEENQPLTFKVGQKLPVLYEAESPENFRLYNFNELIAMPGLGIFIGFILTTPGVLGIFKRFRR